MRYFVAVGSRTFEVCLDPDGVTVDGVSVAADLAQVSGTDVYSLTLDGRSYRLLARHGGAGIWDLHVEGRRVRAEALDERTRAIREITGAVAAAAGPRPVRAPMPGLVVKLEVAEGERVAQGQGIVIVEAMKMENELKAEADGVVWRIHVAPGDTVEKDQVLIELRALEPAAGGKG